METSSSVQELKELTAHTILDFVQMKGFSEDPLILSVGDGIHVRDVEGREYIDGLSGVYCMNLGHGREEVIDAISAQLRTLAFASPILAANVPALELTRELMELTEGRYGTVKLFSGGSEAIEAAIRMARQYHRQTGSPGRYKVISLYRSYHGSTLASLSATGWAAQRSVYEPLAAGFVHCHPPTEAAPGGDDAFWAELIGRTIELEGPETVAAVLVEPVMTSAGVHVPPPEFMSTLRRICDETGVLLVYDEVITALGRLGHWFGAAYHDVWPDILCAGKGLAAGYSPLAATLLREDIARAFWGEPGDGREFKAGHTFAGNPVSAAAGLAVLAYIRDHDVLDHVRREGEALRGRLERLVAEHHAVTAARGLGFLWAIDLDPAAVAAEGLPIGRRVGHECRTRGLLVRPADAMIVLAPPFTSTAQELAEIVAIFEESIASVVKAGGA